MARGHEFDDSMQPTRSGRRVVGPRRVLLAHADGSACDMLISHIDGIFGEVALLEVNSVEAGRAALHAEPLAVCFVCLDILPAPRGAVRLAQEALRVGVPLVLVARSLRWLPHDADELRKIPWVRPEATAAELTQVILQAGGLAAAAASAWESDWPTRTGSGSR